ncbi:MAG: helix-turn-helix domain-containing protein [Candidatus Hodarchaeales archaeon]|jgi:sugar-specific transcriptional regulator TrmB
MTASEIDFNLSKSESKILSTLNIFGGQIKKDLSVISEIQADKAEEAITKLLEKGFIRFEESTEMIYPTLPISALISMISSNISEIERKKDEQNHFFQTSKENIDSQLSEFEAQTNENLEQLQKFNQSLENSLKEVLLKKDKTQQSHLDEIVDELVTSVNSSMVESENKSALE